jgi:hypothetical protein
LGYAKLGETLSKILKKEYYEFSKYIAGKFWGCYKRYHCIVAILGSMCIVLKKRLLWFNFF